MALNDDGTLFIANENDGIRAFTFDGISFLHKAHINNGGRAKDIAVGPDGTVFLANYLDGLRAYTYNDVSFTEAGHFDDDGVGWGVTVSSDGIVFFANGQPGLYALTYSNGSFSKTSVKAWGWTYSADISPNGTIFTTDIYGIIAYTYNLEYNFLATVGYNNTTGSLRGVTAFSDSLVLLTGAAFYVYDYDGDEGVFSPSAYTNQAGGLATRITIAPNNKILLANGANGMRSYTLEDSSFVNEANINPGVSITDVGVNADGTVFWGYYDAGLWAYTYKNATYDSAAFYSGYFSPNDIALGHDGTIFIANGYSGLSAFSYKDASFSNPVTIDEGGIARSVIVGDDGTIFLGVASNLYAYTFDGSSFTKVGTIPSIFDTRGLALGPDGTLFVARASYGVTAYSYDGAEFTTAGTVREDLNSLAWNVTVGTDGTVFVAYHSLGLFAYAYDGAAFTKLAFINNSTDPAINTFVGVAVGNEGTIYSAQNGDGLYAYKFSGYDDAYNSPPSASDTTIIPDSDVYIFSLADFNYTDESAMVKVRITRLEESGSLEYKNNDTWQEIVQYQDINRADIEAGKFRFVYDGVSTDTTNFLFRVHDGTIFSIFNNTVTFVLSSILSVEPETRFVPAEFALHQNYPNPFNPTTTIKYSLAKTGPVTLAVYNLLGKKMLELVNEEKAAGEYTYNLDLSSYSSGIYYYQIKADGYTAVRRLLLLK